jgi:hypothetical protein
VIADYWTLNSSERGKAGFAKIISHVNPSIHFDHTTGFFISKLFVASSAEQLC